MERLLHPAPGGLAPPSVSSHLLLVEDEAGIRTNLEHALARHGYHVTAVGTAEEAISVLGSVTPDLVLLDLHLPGLEGHDVLEHIRRDERTRMLPVVVLTGGLDRGDRLLALSAGVTDFLQKPFDAEELAIRIAARLRFKNLTDGLEDAAQLMVSLARVVDARDPYTAGHSDRVSNYATALANRVGLCPASVGVVRVGALFHDIGKIAIRDHVLRKPSRLTAEEYEEMKTHPVEGCRLIEPLRTLEATLPIVQHHHERLDGSGYPDGLVGDAIPMIVRVTSIADVFDALTTSRPYRSAFPPAEAIETMRAEARRGWWEESLIDELESLITCGMLRAPCLPRE
jgi:putative two-component system response regulator